MTLLTVLLTVLVFALLFAAMAVGVLFGRAPIKGSCGGLGAVGIKEDCTFCGRPSEDCPKKAALRAGNGGAPGVSTIAPPR
jgi:hypothetical protein